MKKNFLRPLSFALIAGIMFSCSSDDDATPNTPSYASENFLAGYLEATGFNEAEEEFIDSDHKEKGIEFTTLVTGKMTAIKIQLPTAVTGVRITIWDGENASVLRTETVDVLAAYTEYSFNIVDLELIKDKTYAITMNTKDYINRTRDNYTDVIYPITVGNIQINGFYSSLGLGQVYPTGSYLQIYQGDLSFDFIQTEE